MPKGSNVDAERRGCWTWRVLRMKAATRSRCQSLRVLRVEGARPRESEA